VKRLLTIVVLHVFLLNVLGYYGILLGLRAHAGEELSEMLNSDMYDLGGSVTFKIPLTVPYGVNSEFYERVSGEFEKDGVTYRMVKQRLYHDILYIVCVKDDLSSKINQALADLAQSFAGQGDDDQKTAAPGFIKDYITSITSLASSQPGWQLEVVKTSVPRYFFDSYFSSIVHPPDRLV
jgi:hypothetical protein